LSCALTAIPRPLPAAVELAGYRVVQEKPDQRDPVCSRPPRQRSTWPIATTGSWSWLTDDGAWCSGPVRPQSLVAGVGLAGLRERARLLGGQLEAGSDAERDFAVRAVSFLPGPP